MLPKQLSLQILKYTSAKAIVLFIVYCCLIAAKLMAQPVAGNFITIPNMPTKEVYKVLIDKKGFLWVAHELGISRYDGISFTHFSMPNATSLSVVDMEEDEQGTIWCNNISGQVYCIEKEQIRLFKQFDYQQQTFISFLSVIKNELVITSINGLFIYNLKTKKARYLYNNDEIIFNGIKHKNSYTMLTNKGWIYYVPNKGLINLKPNKDYYFENKRGEYSLYNVNDTLYLKNRLAGNVHTAYLKNDSLIFFTNRIAKNIFNVEDISKKEVVQQVNNLAISPYNSIIRKLSISDIVYDSEGNLWLSSLTNGLLLYVKKEKYTIEKPSGIPNTEQVLQVVEVNNGLLYTTNNQNIYFKTTHAAALRKYTHPNKKIEKVYKTANANTVLVSTPEYPYILNISTGKHTHLPYVPAIKDACFTNNIALVATATGLYPFYVNDTTLKNEPNAIIQSLVNTPTKNFENVFNQRMRSIVFDSSNKIIYAASKQGLLKISAKGAEFIISNGKNIYASSLQIINNSLYVGTLNDGLFIVEPTGNIKNITANNGLLSNTIVQLKYVQNFLWIVNINGIQQYNVATNKITHQYTLQQVSGTVVKDIAIRNGNIYFSTATGVYSTPFKTSNNNLAPLNYFLYAIFNTSDTVVNNEVVKAHKFNDVQIKLAAIWYSNPRAVYFKYRLIKNADSTNFIIAEKAQRIFTFLDLSPGKYYFEAIAINDNNTASAAPVQFLFTITKPWWQTTVAYILFGMLFLLSIYFLGKLRIDYIKNRNKLLVEKLELQHQLDASLLKAIKSQMNPHFIFNALNTIKSYIYTNNKQEANIYLNKFSSLIRFVLEASDKESIALIEEIELLQLYTDLEKMRFEDDLFIEIQVQENISTDALFLPPMLVQPYVENAIKHGLLHKKGIKKLTISFSLSANKTELIIFISDNGIGRVQSQLINKKRNEGFTSFATQANEQRINIINQQMHTKIQLQIIDKQNEKGEAAGTDVIIKIPVDVLKN